jgi:hypothetical protein
MTRQKHLTPMSNERRVAAYTRSGRKLTAKQLRRIRKHEHTERGRA